MKERVDWPGRPKYVIRGIEGREIPEDEPVFVLRGQDALAAAVVTWYAILYESATGDQATANQIREHARDMALWKPKKIPD